MNTAKPLASVQVDLDGLWALLEHLGHRWAPEEDPLFRDALPRFLDLFEEYAVRATFFTVGVDLAIRWKADLIRDAAKRGHEIACHGFKHASGFYRLNELDLRQEVLQSLEGVEKVVGVRPWGFRAPHFAFNRDLLKILDRLEFSYDSSLLLTPLSPLLRRAKALLAGHAAGGASYMTGAGILASVLKPSRPSPASVYTRGCGRLWEVPVTTFPYLRIPFHGSYAVALAKWAPALALIRSGLRIHHYRQTPVVYLFHLADLADPIGDKRLKGHLGFDTEVSKKRSLCSQILEGILAQFRALPTGECVNTWRESYPW